MISPQTTLKSLYETDYALWLDQTLNHLKNQNINQLDWENLTKEIEELGNELRHKVDSYLKQLLIHLLLYRYWTTEKERFDVGWRDEIDNFRDELELLLASKTLYNYFLTRIDVMYLQARRRVIKKTQLPPTTFPEKCPFESSELMDFYFY